MNEILLFSSYTDPSIVAAVSQVIARGTNWIEGPEIKTFEKGLANLQERELATAFNSGTSGLYALLVALGITSGEVIVPSFTFAATANAVCAAGATPVFADIEDKTFGLSAKSVASLITPRTRAILPIHFAGNVSIEIPEIQKLAQKYGVLLLEDNAHSCGARKEGKQAGTFGHAAMLSFAFNKVLATGEGGAVVTNDAALDREMRLIRAHGRATDGNRDYVRWGHNMRMPTVIAALGIAQLNKFDFLVQQRRRMAAFYDEYFSPLPGLTTPQKLPGHESVYQLYNILLPHRDRRNALIRYLSEKRIPTRVTYEPVHLFSYFRQTFHYEPGSLPVTEDISSRILTLPLHLGLQDQDLQHIATTVSDFLGKCD